MRTIRGKAGSWRTRLLMAGVSLMLPVIVVTAQSVPPLVNYQGRLANPDGSPLPTAQYELSFRVWDATTNGALMWGPQIFDGPTNAVPGHGSRIPVVQGYFNVLLGPVDINTNSIANAFNAPNRFVEVTVSNRPPILPRQQILSTPFAFQAAVAGSLANPPGMALIPGGSFTMGNSVAADTDITDAAATNVNVSAFYMDVNEVTWSQWQSVYYWATNHGYGFENAGEGMGANHPVQTVNWYDCVKWCNARSEQAGKPPVYYTDAGLTVVYRTGRVTVYPNWAAKGYRLPTEAEWEKAARGGLSGQRFPWGNVINQNLANYFGATSFYSYDLGPNGYSAAFTNGGAPYTSPVGSFAANGYGLNDMAGNVTEWCWDWYARPAYPAGSPYLGGGDPHGPPGPLFNRVIRGGSWVSYAFYCRSAYRSSTLPDYRGSDIGFRVVLAPGQ